MNGRASGNLMLLGDTGQTVPPDQDIRGYSVKDSDGADLGRVDDLLVDTGEGRVRFLRVEHGGILGFGATPIFIPVDAVRRVSEGKVRVELSRQRIAGAPRYDPDLLDERGYYSDLYGYYGYPPYWAAGYLYPGIPPGQ